MIHQAQGELDVPSSIPRPRCGAAASWTCGWRCCSAP